MLYIPMAICAVAVPSSMYNTLLKKLCLSQEITVPLTIISLFGARMSLLHILYSSASVAVVELLDPSIVGSW